MADAYALAVEYLRFSEEQANKDEVLKFRHYV